MYSGGKNNPPKLIPTSVLDRLHCPVFEKDPKGKDIGPFDRGIGCNGDPKAPKGNPSHEGLDGSHLNQCVDPSSNAKKQYYLYPSKDSNYTKKMLRLRQFAASIWKGMRKNLKRQYPQYIPQEALVDAFAEFMKKIRMGTPAIPTGMNIPGTKEPLLMPLGFCYQEKKIKTKTGEKIPIKIPMAHGGEYSVKLVRGKTKSKPDEKNICQGMEKSGLMVYWDCQCSVPGQGKECENLKAENFGVFKPKSGSIKGTLYINSRTHEIIPIPLDQGAHPPKGYTPITLKNLQAALSHHDKDGEKLIFKQLPIKRHDQIFRETDDTGDKIKFAIHIDIATFLARYNEYDKATHEGRVFGRIRLSPTEAEALVRYINANMKVARGTKLNQSNFCFDPKSKMTHADGTISYEYQFPRDKQLFIDLREMLKKPSLIKRSFVFLRLSSTKYKPVSGLSKKVIGEIKTKLNNWLEEYDAAEKMKWLQIWMTVGGAFAGAYLFGWVMMFQKMWEVHKKVIGTAVKLPYTGPKWIYNYTKIKIKLRRGTPLTDPEKEWWKNWTEWKMRMKMPAWKVKLLGVVQDGRSQVDMHKEKLMQNPDRIIIGKQTVESTKEYVLAMKKSKFGHPSLHGDSGSGKEMVLHCFAQKVAMAKLWEDPKFQARVQAMGPEVVQAYIDAANLIDTDELRTKEVYIADLTAMQADTSLRGEFAAVLKALKTAAEIGNSLITFKELPDNLEAGAAGSKDGEVHAESFAPQFKQMLERAKAHYGMDTLSYRLLKMLRNPKFDDFIRRFHLIHVKTPTPKEVLEIMRGRYVLGEFEDSHNVKITPEAVEAATRLGIHFYGRSGPPFNAAYSTLENAIQHAKEKATAAGQTNGQPLTITKQHIAEYLKEKKGADLSANDPNGDHVGRDTMELGREHFTTQEGVKAAKALEEGIRSGTIRIPVEESMLDRMLDFSEDFRVRRLALAIDAKQLDEDLAKTYETDKGKAQIAYEAVRYARRMLEILGDRDFGADDKQWEAFVDNNLRKVRPIGWRDAGIVGLIRSVGHWHVLREMNRAKYDSPDTMIKVGKFLAQSFKRHQAQWFGSLTEQERIQLQAGKLQPPSLEGFIEEYETFRTLESNALPGREYNPWIRSNEEMVLAKAILANNEYSSEHLESYFGRFRREALRVMTQRLMKINEAHGYMLDTQDLIEQHLSAVIPITIYELEKAAKALNVQLDDNIRKIALKLDFSKYANENHLLDVASKLAQVEPGSDLPALERSYRDQTRHLYDPNSPKGPTGGSSGSGSSPASASGISRSSARYRRGSGGDVARAPKRAMEDVIHPKIREFRGRIFESLKSAGYSESVANKKTAMFLKSLMKNERRMRYAMKLPHLTLKTFVMAWARGESAQGLHGALNWSANSTLVRRPSVENREERRSRSEELLRDVVGMEGRGRIRGKFFKK